jgi:TIGR03009 family protein
MRRLGPTLAACLAAATVAAAQPPVPGQPVPTAAPAANPQLDAHLNGWEKTMGQLVNFSAEFELVRKDNVFKTERVYGGKVLCMKPNFALLSIQGKADKNDYEAFLSNGKSVYHYDGPKKLITEFKLNPAGGADNLMLDFLGGMKAADAQRRFKITVVADDPTKDPNYVVLAIEPIFPRDKQEFTDARLALLAPTNVAKLPPYLPAVVWLQQPNGNTEEWRLRTHQVNQAGVEPKIFEFQMVKGFQFQQAPPPAPPGPAPGALPAGGVPPRP